MTTQPDHLLIAWWAKNLGEFKIVFSGPPPVPVAIPPAFVATTGNPLA